MTSTNHKSKVADKRLQAEMEFAKLVENTCVRGFHGTASVTISVQDGHVQHTKIAVERMIK